MKKIILFLNIFCLTINHISSKNLLNVFEDWHDHRLSLLSKQELDSLLCPSYPRMNALKGGLVLGAIGALIDYQMSFSISVNNGSLKAYFQNYIYLIGFATVGLWLGHWRGLKIQKKIRDGSISGKA